MNNNKPPLLLLIPFVLIGLILLIVAIYSVYSTMINTKEYIITQGEFVGSSIYSSNRDGTTYKLTYSYNVNGEQYRISTDFGTSSIPKEGSSKMIKYNPHNPQEAIITGFSGIQVLLIVGIMFFTIPLIIIFESVILVGISFILIGSGIYYMMCASTDSLSLIEGFKTNGLWILVPIVFVLVGIWAMIGRFFINRNKEITVKVEKIQSIESDNKVKILFTDEKIADNSIFSATAKYFVYETSSPNKFEVGREYRFNIYKYGIMFSLEPITDILQARVLKSFKDEDFNSEVW